MKKDKTITIRLSEDDLRRMKARAKELGLSTTELIIIKTAR